MADERPVREPVTLLLEDPEGVTLVVELPGVPQDAIKMALAKDIVKVEAEGNRGKFSTIQVVPFEPDPDRVAVSYSQGVFEVSLRRKGSPQPPSPEKGEVIRKEELSISMGSLLKENEQLRKDLSAGTERASALESKLKLLMMDYNNLKRRSESDRELMADRKVEELGVALAEVLDSFKRARSSIGEVPAGGTEMQRLLKGIQMIEGSVEDQLRRFGITVISCAGAPFDPNFHEALGFMDDESREDGAVLEEVNRGYQYKGRTIRPAKVMVNKRKERAHKGGRKGKQGEGEQRKGDESKDQDKNKR